MQTSIHSTITLCQLQKGDAFYHGHGLTITYATINSPMGDCFIANSNAGIVYLGFPTSGQVESLLQLLAKTWPQATLVAEDKIGLGDEKQIALLSRQIFALDNADKPPTMTLLVKGTPFQLSVWQALLNIPVGSTCVYADIARQVQHPQAYRAVGSAVGKNPVSYLIPCHRVLPQSGGAGNYLWGRACKEKLLVAEQKYTPPR